MMLRSLGPEKRSLGQLRFLLDVTLSRNCSRGDTSMSSTPVGNSEDDDINVISIDRSGLILPKTLRNKPPKKASKNFGEGTPSAAKKEDGDQWAHANAKNIDSEMVKHLKSLIRFRGGPLTVAEYMSEVLTHPTAGYYTTRNVLGKAGDFVTSPEISQMFGEMIGIWCVAMWHQLRCPTRLRLVECGPGRGTLLMDLLRGSSAFRGFTESLVIDLIEVSPLLRQKQWESLGCDGQWSEGMSQGLTAGGVPVQWHTDLGQVPSEDGVPELFIAHEFFDALPVHQFVKTDDRGWREAVVDVDDKEEEEGDQGDRQQFRMVLSPFDTFASRTVLTARLHDIDPKIEASLRGIEISPASIALADGLARRVSRQGGAALLIDYGQDGPYETSLVAIKGHEFVDIFEDPGTCDLSAYVDFSALRSAVGRVASELDSGSDDQEGKSPSHHVRMYGPITQAIFLKSVGIDARLESLAKIGTKEQQQALLSGYKRLVGGSEQQSKDEPPGMGERYKAVCIASSIVGPPAFQD
eukprot:jgi/Picsp_1/3380/NSC_06218-R1_-like protein